MASVELVAMNQDAQQSQPRVTYNTLLAMAATYLGTLALIAYPLGFIILWVQVWRGYTYGTDTALYAASLVPVPVVIAKSFAVLGTALFILSTVSAIFAESIMSYWVVSVHREDFERLLSGSRFRRSFLLGRKWQVVHLILGFLAAAFLPWALGFVSLDEGMDVFCFVCAVLVAGGGAITGALVLSRRPGELPEERKPYTTAVPVIVGSTVIACLLLVPVLPAKLPVVHFSEGAVNEATLITHSQGYWYVLGGDEAGVTALPNDEVGMVTISES